MINGNNGKDNRINSKILIVDDVPQNIQVLANILKEAGYQMGFAKDAKTALAHTESTQFDLILLDIMMPEVDGYELCARLKEDKRKRDIPVIFVTAKSETADKTKGFELGAVDYITKPFDVQEVLARVKTHLTIRNYATKLEQMVEERTRQLIHADRLATLGTFSAAIVHEINNPLSHVQGNAKLLKLFWNALKPIVKMNLEGHVERNVKRHVEGHEEGYVEGHGEMRAGRHEEMRAGRHGERHIGEDATVAVREDTTVKVREDRTVPVREDATVTVREDTTVAVREDRIVPVREDDETIMMVRKDMDGVDEALTCLLNGCYRISQLTNSLKTYSRQSNARKGRSSLIDIIHDALHVVIHKLKFKGITVDVAVPTGLMIYCDQQKLSQVFINLIDNACDAMEKRGGEIAISATAVNGTVSHGRESGIPVRESRNPVNDQDNQDDQDDRNDRNGQNDQNGQKGQEHDQNDQEYDQHDQGHDQHDQGHDKKHDQEYDRIDIRITDNGTGIPDEVADKIFNPFFTTKGMDEGTGLGLFIVRNIIEEHQGKISLSPFAGKGAEFHITLPLG